MRLSLILAIIFLFASPVGAEQEQELSSYPLDTLSRTVSADGKMKCPRVPMVKHRGTHIRYHKPVTIYEGFQSHLERFEAIASEVGIEVYGRAPKTIVHVGTFNCRRIRKYPELLSEHGIGNAIDVEGFDFSKASTKDQKSAAPNKRLGRAFKVRLAKHWDSTRGDGALHSIFLHRITERLLEDDVFRVLLGPSYPGHKGHFHFDVAPYRLVQL